MFSEFLRFELSYWLRGWMVYIFFAVIALLFGLAAGSDAIMIAGVGGNTLRNSPFSVAMWYAGASLITAFMAAAIYDSSASRDFANKMSDILFSKPLSKWGFLLGRFFGATLAALIPAVGIGFGILTAHLLNASDTERWGPSAFWHHWQPFLIFVIPNTLIFGALVFAIASVTRNTLYSFLSLLAVLILYGITQGIAGQLDYEGLAAWTDPFGSAPFDQATKYWTVSDRNTRSIPLTPLLIGNRVLWLAVASLVFWMAGKRFRFETSVASPKQASTIVSPNAPATDQILVDQAAAMNISALKRPQQPSWFSQFFSTLGSDLSAVIFSKTFIILLGFTLINVGFSLALGSADMFGSSSFPVTYRVIEQVSGSLLILPIALITYFTGVLVWRDRDSRFHEILGATPVPNSVFAASRWVSMLILLLSVLLVGIAIGVFYQWTQGFYRFQLGVYFQELIGITGLSFLFLMVISFLAHTLAPNKYIGYALFVLFLVVNGRIWSLLRWNTLLFRFGALPEHTYSDMFGIAPFKTGLLAFGAYWLLVSGVLIWLTSALMHRGVAKRIKERLGILLREISLRNAILPAAFAVSAIGMGIWLAYNTMVVNKLVGSTKREQLQVLYEKTYSDLAGLPQPKIQSIQYKIDIYPETRNLQMSAVQMIANKSDQPIDRFFINISPDLETQITIPRTQLEKDDQDLMFRIYRVDPPMQPGETLQMEYTIKSNTHGIENQVTNTQLVQNGTFFNNGIAPSFGYDENRRVVLPRRRKQNGLDPVDPLPELKRDCDATCNVHYISNDADWVSVETVISTSDDQIAVAPGSLVEQWKDAGRSYYRYRVDHPSLNFYSFISARYEVERGKVGDIDTEVYYHKEHAWNVPKMSKAIADTLEYCTKEFGPYKHKQARIIEFPRVASFAQAFPGTMPYSESIGFIANLGKPDDIDMVTYIVAHEMGHQWWAHQVIGAKVQGATLLSETLAQYTALMVMRKTYGDDMMHKFFRYEMDNYLRSRGGEQLKERPLMNVELTQGYIHYQKGGLALYYLAEMIGEQRINAALKQLIEQYAYKGPPYPNAYALIDRLKEQTPEELRYLITDLFEQITLFENKTLDATAEKQADGKYLVRISIQCAKKNADEKGLETVVPMNDYLEIGAFAKPEPGKRYGKSLHRERVQLTDGKHELEFVVDELPFQAGVDPRNLLIDTVPADNLKKVTIK
ncbi:MAG: M1 family aminopeptidase [Planctomycetota bacterium]|jgi:ABC-2 type transport system permease protein